MCRERVACEGVQGSGIEAQPRHCTTQRFPASRTTCTTTTPGFHYKPQRFQAPLLPRQQHALATFATSTYPPVAPFILAPHLWQPRHLASSLTGHACPRSLPT